MLQGDGGHSPALVLSTDALSLLGIERSYIWHPQDDGELEFGHDEITRSLVSALLDKEHDLVLDKLATSDIDEQKLTVLADWEASGMARKQVDRERSEPR